jgi:endonuclease/exonuclease/phosphatase family metal-dependent hydrolase
MKTYIVNVAAIACLLISVLHLAERKWLVLNSYWQARIYVLLPLLLLLHLLLLWLSMSRTYHKAGRVLLLSLLILAVTYWQVTFGAFMPGKTDRGDRSVEVLTYNIGFFDIPGVFSKAYYDSAALENMLQARNWLSEQKADIICLQEFYNDTGMPLHDNLAYIGRAGGMSNAYFFHKVNPSNKTARGLAIFSRHPIVNRGEIFLGENNFNGAAFADVAINGDTIRVINAHLASMELLSIYRGRNFLKYAHALLQTYLQSTELRIEQTETLLAQVRQSPYKVIIGLDLNETPYSRPYLMLSSELRNAFEQKSLHAGFSYRSRPLSFLRIDHLFTSDDFRTKEFEVLTDVGFSEHWPVKAVFRW